MKLIPVLLALIALPLTAAETAGQKREIKTEFVAVGGEVKKPGKVACPMNSTILAMIYAAGGPTNFGSMRRVKVFRNGKSLEFDLTKDKVKSEALAKPDDVIEVPAKNFFGR